VKLDHHDDKDPNKKSNKVGAESKSMLDVVHIAMVCPLLSMISWVSNTIYPRKNQEAKVELWYGDQ
jgi:hypothetical protein